MATDYSQFTTAGLSGAQSAINNTANSPYPNYTGGSKTNPYATQQNATGMQGSGYNPQQGVYQSLGRDANAIRNDYSATANQAWDKSQGAIKNMYGANGLYGSLGGGLMSGALQDGAQNYMTGMSASRLAADNAIMEDENNRASSYRDAYELQGNQQLDQWKAGQTATEYNNNLIGSRAQFGNSQIDAQYADQLARRQDQSAFDQTRIENYLGLAGGGSPGAAAQMQANAQKSAAESAAKASNTGAWLGAAGALGGGLLSGIGEANGWSNFWK
jgi:hypothetical protein